MDIKKLQKYANLIAKTGGNVKKGDSVVVQASVETSDFAKMVVEECYKLGAKKVEMDWGCMDIAKLGIDYQDLETLSKVEDHEVAKLNFRKDTLPVMIYLLSDDPDGYANIDQLKYAKAQQAVLSVTRPIRAQMENKYKWSIAGVPSEKWAKKVFPDLDTDAAIEKLWDAILKTARADGDDPNFAWEKHNEDLKKRCAYLNSLGIERLEYKDANGTDLTVGLIENADFLGGSEKILDGVEFNPNIPSEEVFTSPKKGVAEGVVYSSLPLSYNGEIISDFSLKFHEGKVCEVHAKKNEALLKEMVSVDEGAKYLGECALVPFDSPIRNSGVLFYQTLFDENAACHFAVGFGFTNVIRDYDKYTNDECHKMGVNESHTHVDFMIGTKTLNINAYTKDGKCIAIFKDGNWAF